MSRDKDYISLITSKRWVKLRRAILTKRPLCERCEAEDRITPATEVHHHTPVEYATSYAEKRRLMFEASNLRALCHACHVRVHVEMGRGGKEANRRKTKAQVQTIVKKYFED